MNKIKSVYVKRLVSTFLISVLPVTTFAYPLTITNLTKSTVSVKVNGQCSAEFGNINSMVSHSAETKGLESKCKANSNNCLVQIIAVPSCAADGIAHFNFNTKTRINGHGEAGPGYKISADAHRVTVSKV